MTQPDSQSREPQTREYLRANLFDGNEGGMFTAPLATFLTDLVEVVDEYMTEASAAARAEVAGALDEILLRYINRSFGRAEGIECRNAVLALLDQRPPEVPEPRPRPSDDDGSWQAIRTALAVAKQGPEPPDERFVAMLHSLGFEVRFAAVRPPEVDAGGEGR